MYRKKEKSDLRTNLSIFTKHRTTKHRTALVVCENEDNKINKQAKELTFSLQEET